MATNNTITPEHPDAPLFKALHRRELLTVQQAATADHLSSYEMDGLWDQIAALEQAGYHGHEMVTRFLERVEDFAVQRRNGGMRPAA